MLGPIVSFGYRLTRPGLVDLSSLVGRNANMLSLTTLVEWRPMRWLGEQNWESVVETQHHEKTYKGIPAIRQPGGSSASICLSSVLMCLERARYQDVQSAHQSTAQKDSVGGCQSLAPFASQFLGSTLDATSSLGYMAAADKISVRRGGVRRRL